MCSLRYIEKSMRWEGNTIPLFRYDGNATIHMYVGGSLTGSTWVWGLWPRSALSGTSRFSPKPYTLNPSPETGLVDACSLAGTGPCRFFFWRGHQGFSSTPLTNCVYFFFLAHEALDMCRWRRCPPSHTHTHMRTYVHTYTHKYMNAYIHTYIYTYILMIHTCVHLHIPPPRPPLPLLPASLTPRCRPLR
jgi:hypothetical protein